MVRSRLIRRLTAAVIIGASSLLIRQGELQAAASMCVTRWCASSCSANPCDLNGYCPSKTCEWTGSCLGTDGTWYPAEIECYWAT